MNFLSNNKVTIAIASGDRAAGTTDINGATLDMTGFFGVTGIVEFGTLASGAVTSIKWQQGDESSGSDMSDLENTEQTVAATDDNEIFLSELYRPTKRYVRLVVDRGSSNATIATALYVQSSPIKAAVSSHGSGVNAAATYVGPDEE